MHHLILFSIKKKTNYSTSRKVLSEMSLRSKGWECEKSYHNTRYFTYAKIIKWQVLVHTAHIIISSFISIAEKHELKTTGRTCHSIADWSFCVSSISNGCLHLKFVLFSIGGKLSNQDDVYWNEKLACLADPSICSKNN